MWPWIWCMLLVAQSGEVRTQTENQVVFQLGSFQNVSVSHNETVQATVSGIPDTVAFVTLQFHTQHRSTALSFTRVPGAALSAPDTGLLSTLAPGQTSLSLFLTTLDRYPVAGMGVTLPYTSADPVPGACNGVFGLGTDPNLYLTYNLYETTLRFAPASVGYARGATPPPCNVSTETAVRRRLLYDVYRFLLPAGDLSEGGLFSGLQKVASAQSLGANPGLGADSSLGTDVRLVTTLSWENDTVAVVSSVLGRGAVYAVVVRDPERNTSASYVPVHTYACSFDSALEGCLTLGQISTKVFFTLSGLAGLFVCFFGHRFFKCELFCMGFAFVCFLFFVLITWTTTLDYDLRLALAAVLGVVGGAVLVTCWWRFGSVMACVAVVGLILGFFVASTVFFTPFGELEVFQGSEVAFWVTYCCLVLAVSLVMVRWPREGNIITCGVVGGYCVVLAVNVYVSTSLSYITLNVLKRFLNPNFDPAFTDVSFHDIDFVLITLWVVLGASGVVLQLYRERSRPFFPPSPYLMWLQERERRKTNVLDPSHHGATPAGRLLARLRQLTRRREPNGEHTPLLL
ncbi:transmembrane 7 superfamily member 3 isoform X1 [Gadus morhua]|uniref:transmembrane 7 superfamily member 3 isoform X1 n=1 Tax=Gadus morhua TaxID=8049 RepID=UPI0011B4E579|nr:transmembrane 7 superfamily member 3 isoform X1 [Gadus morhua]